VNESRDLSREGVVRRRVNVMSNKVHFGDSSVFCRDLCRSKGSIRRF
jgi:hypothetical protein